MTLAIFGGRIRGGKKTGGRPVTNCNRRSMSYKKMSNLGDRKRIGGGGDLLRFVVEEGLLEGVAFIRKWTSHHAKS